MGVNSGSANAGFHKPGPFLKEVGMWKVGYSSGDITMVYRPCGRERISS